ncbi:MAG: hypothetical protein N4A54_12920 [Peptostreptococcaceae bacterium]|jgi:hypothetical protein|nr:hypothetical protein [Peptostreptococcaceae bacterium]
MKMIGFRLFDDYSKKSIFNNTKITCSNPYIKVDRNNHDIFILKGQMNEIETFEISNPYYFKENLKLNTDDITLNDVFLIPNTNYIFKAEETLLRIKYTNTKSKFIGFIKEDKNKINLFKTLNEDNKEIFIKTKKDIEGDLILFSTNKESMYLISDYQIIENEDNKILKKIILKENLILDIDKDYELYNAYDIRIDKNTNESILYFSRLNEDSYFYIKDISDDKIYEKNINLNKLNILQIE